MDVKVGDLYNNCGEETIIITKVFNRTICAELYYEYYSKFSGYMYEKGRLWYTYAPIHVIDDWEKINKVAKKSHLPKWW